MMEVETSANNEDVEMEKFVEKVCKFSGTSTVSFSEGTKDYQPGSGQGQQGSRPSGPEFSFQNCQQVCHF